MNNARVALEHRYIEKTHGAEKYECLKVSGTTISGSHYVSENAYWGSISYQLVSSDSELQSDCFVFVDENGNVYNNEHDGRVEYVLKTTHENLTRGFWSNFTYDMARTYCANRGGRLCDTTELTEYGVSGFHGDRVSDCSWMEGMLSI